MRQHEPELIDGTEVLERREPPSELTFHRILAGFLGASLPLNAAADGMGMDEELEELAFQWRYWRGEHPEVGEAATALSALLMPEIRSELQFPRFLRFSLEEPGRPPPLFSADISDEQALVLARVLLDVLDSYVARRLSGQQLLDTMRARVEALSLPAAR
ncbi:Hypothetical protein A7982_01021 [Minicystis rosea]|nr:Hypothetical protein A7982_01021 [Minicystis rosea]